MIKWSGHSLVAVGRITYKRAPEPRLYSTNCETACAKIPDMMACSVEKPSCEKLRAQAASNVNLDMSFSNRHDTIFAQKLIKSKYPKYWCAVSKTI